MKPTLHTITLLAGLALVANVWAQEGNYEAITREDISKVSKPQYSPYAGRSFPTRVLWGDTHLHTAVSVDAGTMCRVGQEDAFRFARGEEITTTHGLRAKLSRPLDFLVISDHAEMYGLMPQLLSGDPEVLATEKGKKWYQELQSGDTDRAFASAIAPELIQVWTDPDFDASQPAFYYARVIEIPTPRWTACEAQRFGITMSAEVPMTTQERAYTSPIWYNP